MNQYQLFQEKFKLLARKNSKAVVNTLSNIFSMRIIGNKTHGDLAEIGITEFINQFMYDYKSKHVGKDLFRAKEHEEDILIIDEITKKSFPISLKAYGDGPLQLSTDSDSLMFHFLRKEGNEVIRKSTIKNIFASYSFQAFSSINVLPLIYNEKENKCNIMVFDCDKAIRQTAKILFIDKNKKFDFNTNQIISAKGRKHPIYMFLDDNGNYICEVRYGDASANALQRGLWTHTQKALSYFNSLTGWIDYSHNEVLVKLFSLALNATENGHKLANEILQKDIDRLKLCK